MLYHPIVLYLSFIYSTKIPTRGFPFFLMNNNEVYDFRIALFAKPFIHSIEKIE